MKELIMFTPNNNEYLKEYEKERIEVMEKVLLKLSDNFVLKGGTGLLFGYNLNRFSEDIDLDVINPKKNIKNEITNLKIEGYNLNISIKKDTSTTFRVMIDYGGKRSDYPEGLNEYKLKLEVSLRTKGITEKDYRTVNGIKVYKIESLIEQKILAFGARNKARDIYDMDFLLTKYSKHFSTTNYRNLIDIMERRDIDTISYELKLALKEGMLSGIKKEIDPDLFALKLDDKIQKGLEASLKLRKGLTR